MEHQYKPWTAHAQNIRCTCLAYSRNEVSVTNHSWMEGGGAKLFQSRVEKSKDTVREVILACACRGHFDASGAEFPISEDSKGSHHSSRDAVPWKSGTTSCSRMLAMFDSDSSSPSHGIGDWEVWAWGLAMVVDDDSGPEADLMQIKQSAMQCLGPCAASPRKKGSREVAAWMQGQGQTTCTRSTFIMQSWDLKLFVQSSCVTVNRATRAIVIVLWSSQSLRLRNAFEI